MVGGACVCWVYHMILCIDPMLAHILLVPGALCELCKKVVGDPTQEPTSSGSQPREGVYLGQQYVNNQTMSDVTFMVEGQPFYAHRIALLASSDAFRAMFEGNYREREAEEIPIPNIRFEVFEAMMQCIYTGNAKGV